MDAVRERDQAPANGRGWSVIGTIEMSFNAPDDDDLLTMTSEQFNRHEPVARAGSATN